MSAPSPRPRRPFTAARPPRPCTPATWTSRPPSPRQIASSPMPWPSSPRCRVRRTRRASNSRRCVVRRQPARRRPRRRDGASPKPSDDPRRKRLPPRWPRSAEPRSWRVWTRREWRSRRRPKRKLRPRPLGRPRVWRSRPPKRNARPRPTAPRRRRPRLRACAVGPTAWRSGWPTRNDDRSPARHARPADGGSTRISPLIRRCGRRSRPRSPIEPARTWSARRG